MGANRETVLTTPQTEAGGLPEGFLLPSRGNWVGLSFTWYAPNTEWSPFVGNLGTDPILGI